MESITTDTTAPEAASEESTRVGIPLLEMAVAYGLILATVWTRGPMQRVLFWTTAGSFLCAAAAAPFRHTGALAVPWLRLPSWRMTGIMFALALFVVALMVVPAAAMGTLHGLFGTKAPMAHASGYLIWALVQQFIQQAFFFVRMERLLHRGIMASCATAALFGLAHLPNPVLTPVTFFGGWILSEIFRRYRTIYPLGIAHGLIGLAIAISVPDSLQHHMRVGLGYLRYPH